MKIETQEFGILEVEEKDIISFPHGILGFPEYQQYVLLDQDETYFKFLQSIEEPELRFVVVMPELIRPDYTCSLSKEQAFDLDIEEPGDASVYTIVTIPENLADVTANFQAPVIINTKKNIARQIVLMDGGYHTRHNILAEMQKAAFENRKNDSAQSSSSAE